MSNVFANGLEISGKAVGAKTVAVTPDTCFTPPENPATPPGVPVPYLSFGFASDTEKGTSTVFIGGKIVNLKNKSDLSKTSGTEAGSAAKKGLITSKNIGKSYFKSWSNNVKFDDEPVVRNTDLATHNHASPQGNTPPWIHLARANPAWTATCERVYADRIGVYKPNPCVSGYEPHHIVDNCSFVRAGARNTSMGDYKKAAELGKKAWKVLKNMFQKGSPHPGRNYHEDDAPCICLEDNMSDGMEHKKAHDLTRAEAKKAKVSSNGGKWTYKEARDAGVKSVKKAANLTDKEAECVGIILDAYFKEHMGCEDSTEIGGPETKAPTATSFKTGKGGSANISPIPA